MNGLWLTIMTVGLGVSVYADDPGPAPARVRSDANPPPVMTVRDVESINDQLARFDGQMVKVAGEIENKIDRQSFVLESGGFIDNEIVVVAKEGSPIKVSELADDQDLVVIGKLQAVPIVDVRREVSWWDLDPQMEAELDDIQGVIIAESITTRR